MAPLPESFFGSRACNWCRQRTCSRNTCPLQLPPEEVRNGRKMTVIAEPGADEAKGGLFGE